MENDRYRLVIIEDNLIVLSALKWYFGASSAFELVFTATSTEQFIDLWKEQHVDIILSDIGLPGKSGIEATVYVKRRSKHTQVVMFSVFEDKDTISQAFCAGAAGYLHKDTPMAVVEEELLKVMQVEKSKNSSVAYGVSNIEMDKPKHYEVGDVVPSSHFRLAYM